MIINSALSLLNTNTHTHVPVRMHVNKAVWYALPLMTSLELMSVPTLCPCVCVCACPLCVCVCVYAWAFLMLT